MLKPEVLREKKDFSLIYNRGKSLGDRFVVLFYRKNGLSYNRIAFLASKKVGKSVRRNRARRLMKESFRQIREEVLTGYDLVIIARNTINGADFLKVKQSLVHALQRGRLWKGEKQ